MAGALPECRRSTSNRIPPCRLWSCSSRACGRKACAQRELMAELAITFDGNAYHLGTYRYTALDDAVNYARLLRAQGRAVD